MVNNAAAYADLTQLVSDLRFAHETIEKASEEILDEVSTKIETLMKQYAPMKTGRLSQSIRTIRSTGRRDIGPHGVPYAVYQEFGTATRGEFGGTMYKIRPKTPGGRLHFQVDGKWVSAKEVNHPGIPPHPFARPAARQALDNIAQTFATKGVELITKGKN